MRRGDERRLGGYGVLSAGRHVGDGVSGGESMGEGDHTVASRSMKAGASAGRRAFGATMDGLGHSAPASTLA